jgi:hypothetical protein
MHALTEAKLDLPGGDLAAEDGGKVSQKDKSPAETSSLTADRSRVSQLSEKNTSPPRNHNTFL